jgi:YfiH family protein
MSVFIVIMVFDCFDFSTGFFPVGETEIWAVAGTMYNKLPERFFGWMSGYYTGIAEGTVSWNDAGYVANLLSSYSHMPIQTQGASHSYRTPAIFADFPDLIAAESTRHGGVSPAPFDSLNLGINTTDTPENVAENRRRFFDAIGAGTHSFASSHQVHGTDVLHATEAGRFEGYDALITNQPGLLIGVTVADCVPILIYDQAHQAVAAIHAGWRGTVGGIVTKTLTMMQQRFGTLAGSCYAYVGTCIDECSFEVGPEVAEQFAATYKQTKSSTGKEYIDLKRANADRLIEFGIPPKQIEVSPYSTVLNNDTYFSYRAAISRAAISRAENGQTGRMLAVIGLKS